ncbi:hypothetical protein EG68_07303 [Paragonimus skrjabini miyazakii]|uniref:Uncharacterized protein n=1 Tax=Paragonimus skrjabini miyazakii TaxID=59628 RepID=A0A8S9YKJ8_9TREM|nr:hypothetical protein EG68_07303 [Paragonimus skrjabini miyazakii]
MAALYHLSAAGTIENVILYQESDPPDRLTATELKDSQCGRYQSVKRIRFPIQCLQDLQSQHSRCMLYLLGQSMLHALSAIWESDAPRRIMAERASVLAPLLDGEAPDIAIDEGILQGDITEGTFRRLLACFTTDPHRLEVCRQFHGRIQHPGEKLVAFIQELRRLCAKGFTDDTPEVREQRILQQFLEGTRDPSTRSAFLTAAPTSIREASDRAGAIEQVNGVIERDQQYRTSEIALEQYRPLARPQPFNRQERYGPHRIQRPPYQKSHCYYCSLYGKRAYRCGHNRAIALKASETQEWAQMQSEDPDLHPIYQRLLQGQSRLTKQEVAGPSRETRCLPLLKHFTPVYRKEEGSQFRRRQWDALD